MSPHIPHPSAARRASFGAAALLAFAPAAAAARAPLVNVATASKATPPAAGTVYGGNTAQDAPFGIRVKRGGAALSQLLLHFRAKCDDGSGLTWSGPADFASIQPPTVAVGENIFAPAKLSRTGSFKASGRGASGFGEDLRGTVRESIRGQVRGANAHGTLDATVDLFAPDGAKVTSCRTGNQRWAAKSAPSRTYAGLTSDRRPVVVELARDGRSVKDFRLGWSAACQPSGGLSIADDLGNFRMSPSGRFGDSFTQEFPLEAGSKVSFAYALAGDAGHSKASGTFQVRTTETDAGGATTATCDSTLLRWTAASSRGPLPRAVKRKLRQIRAD
jgi:hypothetical protein